LDENTGFARGTNVALKSVLNQEGDRVIAIVNNDAIPEPGSLDALASLLMEDRDVGMASGLVLRQAGDSSDPWYAGGTLNRWRADVTMKPWDSVDVSRPRDVSFVSLAFATLRADTVRELGLLEERFFFGQEEWEYSSRVAKAGLRLRYEPAATCIHGGDGSHKNVSVRHMYNGYLNKIIFQEISLSRSQFAVWRFTFFIYAVLLAPLRLSVYHRSVSTAIVGALCALRAHLDYRRGVGVTLAHLDATERGLKSFLARIHLPVEDLHSDRSAG
jgi:GT2 family glycosyltransferase